MYNTGICFLAFLGIVALYFLLLLKWLKDKAIPAAVYEKLETVVEISIKLFALFFLWSMIAWCVWSLYVAFARPSFWR